MAKTFFLLLVLILFSIMPPCPAHASIQSTNDAPPVPVLSDWAEVFLITAGPGKRIWERFGHNAIWFRDSQHQIDIVYHWGVFSFQSDKFWPRFLFNSMRFAIQSLPPQDFLVDKNIACQSLWIQNLSLTTNQMQSLFSLCYLNDTDGFRYYDYDYYNNNCSTRIRDVLDQVLDGAIKQTCSTNITAHTRRWHCRRFLQFFPAVYLGVQCVLGSPADQPISAWDEMFLPLSLQEHLRFVFNPGSGLDDMPLVWSEMPLAVSSVPVPPSPQSYFPYFLMLSFGICFLLVALALHQSNTYCRVAIALLSGVWSLAAGLTGSLLLFAILFTSHSFWFWNQNVFQLNPLSLFLVIPSLLIAFNRKTSVFVLYLAYSVAGLSLFGLLLKLIPFFYQENAEIIAITLPLHCTLTFIFYRQLKIHYH